MTGNGFVRSLDTTKYNGTAINIANYYENAKVTFEDNSNVKINNNYVIGITNRGEVYIGSNTEIMNNGLITSDNKMISQYGGGIYNTGVITINENVKLYNNHARLAGDDIYSIGQITFNRTGQDWILDDCNDKINGWYDDSEDLRWTAHEENYENNHILLFEAGTYTDALAVKAAHDARGVLVVNYVDTDNNKLDDEQTYEETVGTDYTTEEKEFFGYELVKVEGNTTGKYGYDTIYVTYIYKKNICNGDTDILPPQTGVETNLFNITKVEMPKIYKKKEELI